MLFRKSGSGQLQIILFHPSASVIADISTEICFPRINLFAHFESLCEYHDDIYMIEVIGGSKRMYDLRFGLLMYQPYQPYQPSKIVHKHGT